MSDFGYLKANDAFAQYWYKDGNSDHNTSASSRHPYRSVFACDRDRVMYCSAFRRLSSKTQVFNSQVADNLRTRLTHTLEVAQIARTISCKLGLDEELTEAIALGHDVGHTPFGHIGERTLNTFSRGEDKRQIQDGVNISSAHYGFKHNQQSVRVLVEYSERVRFSNFMLFGVREHSKLHWHHPGDVAFYDQYNSYCSYSDGSLIYPAWSFEAYVVKWADEVAQRHHDIEDAYLQKIMSADDIVAKVAALSELYEDDNLKRKYARLKQQAKDLADKDITVIQYPFAHNLSSFLVDAYVTILISEFEKVLDTFSNEHKIKSNEDFQNHYLSIPVGDVRKLMTLNNTKIFDVDKQLGESLKHSILDSYEVQRMDGKGAYTIRKLLRAYMSNPQQLPNQYVNCFIKVELPRSLSEDDIAILRIILDRQLKNSYARDMSQWKDYECREVLRIITQTPLLASMTYDALIRVIFDYIAGMTDSYATSQRTELY